MPVWLWNIRLKWLRLAKPQAAAVSVTETPRNSMLTATSMRMRVRQACTELPNSA
jgi:hypothetical protein